MHGKNALAPRARAPLATARLDAPPLCSAARTSILDLPSIRFVVVLLLMAPLLLAPADKSSQPAGSRPPVATADAVPWIGDYLDKLPLSFEANQGQWTADTAFVAGANGYGVVLAATGAAVSLTAPASLGTSESAAEKPVVRMRMDASNPVVPAIGLEELPGRVNYFIGNNPERWLTDISTFARVAYPDVYPGIDLVFHGIGSQMEYDIVVSPGADLSAVHIAFDNVDDVVLDADGALVLHTLDGFLRQRAPVIYQDTPTGRVLIAGGFAKLDGGLVGFKIDSYDGAIPLVIDPVIALRFSTYLGGTYTETARGIAANSIGQVFVVGATGSLDFPLVNPLQTTCSVCPLNQAAFVSKLDPSTSTLLFSSYLGGSDGGSGAADVALDGSGNAYILGSTRASDFPATPGVFQVTCIRNPFGNCQAAATLTKLTSSGALSYSSYLAAGYNEFGTVGDVDPRAVAVDADGNAYLTGETSSRHFPTTPGAFQTFVTSDPNGFLTKFNATGTALMYSTYIGNASGNSLTVDAGGNAYMGGEGRLGFLTTPGAFQPTPHGNREGVVAKLNPAGSALVYGTFLGGSDTDAVFGIAIDATGNAYVTGQTKSVDFPIVNAFQGSNQWTSTTGDAFITKLNPAGTALVFSTFLGGLTFDYGTDVKVDAAGNVYVVGSTNSADFPLVHSFRSPSANSDAFITKFDPTGQTLVYSTTIGGFANDYSERLALGPSGNAYIVGETFSADFPMARPIQGHIASVGIPDIFVVDVSLVPSSRLNLGVTGGGGVVKVSSPPSGITCSVGCAADFPTGSVVALNAQPDVLTMFVSWSGDCSGTGPCSLEMTTDKNVTATFAPKTYLVTIAKSGNGSGTVTSTPPGLFCGAICAASFVHDTIVTLTAAPALASTFVTWNGACAGSGPCSFALGMDRTIGAEFTAPPGCNPRPPVRVSVVPNDGRLDVIIASTGSSFLQALQFGPSGGNPTGVTNALIDIAGQVGASGSFTVVVPPGSTQVTFSVRRAISGQQTVVPLVVVDSCGPWPTFVGGGPSAFDGYGGPRGRGSSLLSAGIVR